MRDILLCIETASFLDNPACLPLIEMAVSIARDLFTVDGSRSGANA